MIMVIISDTTVTGRMPASNEMTPRRLSAAETMISSSGSSGRMA